MDYKRLPIAFAQIKMEDDDEMVFSGYASVFGGVDSYGDTIIKGAYMETLQNRERPIRMRWNHFGPVIGKYNEIREDDTGLFVRGELTPGHSVAQDVHASMKHGAIDGLSIGFRIKDHETIDGVRHLKAIDLIEISVVEEPADLGAKIGDVKYMREMIDQIDSLKEAETFLRDACGLSRSGATAFASRVKTLARGERGAEPDQLAALVAAIKLIKPKG